mgnify:FL=1
MSMESFNDFPKIQSRQGVLPGFITKSEHEQYEKEFNPDERHTRAFVARFPGVY